MITKANKHTFGAWSKHVGQVERLENAVSRLWLGLDTDRSEEGVLAAFGNGDGASAPPMPWLRLARDMRISTLARARSDEDGKIDLAVPLDRDRSVAMLRTWRWTLRAGREASLLFE